MARTGKISQTIENGFFSPSPRPGEEKCGESGEFSLENKSQLLIENNLYGTHVEKSQGCRGQSATS